MVLSTSVGYKRVSGEFLMLGIAVIGTGNWGKNHVRVYKELMAEGMIDKLKICDADANRARQLGDELKVEWVSDYRDVVKDAGIQAVSIATPSKTHYQVGKEFIEAGRDVLVEKPMTMDTKEAKKLVEFAASHGRILMAGQIFRYHPAVCELKRMIDAGDLGEIQNIIGNRMYFGLPRRDMGVIYALGIHELDTFCYLLGVDYPKSIIAAASKSYGRDIEETATISADFGHARGYAFESWLVPAYGKMRDLVVVGNKRSARVDYLTPQELYVFDNRIIIDKGIPIRVEDKGKRTISIPHAEPLKEEIKHFISCVISRQNPLSDGVVGLRAVTMAEAALKSAKIGEAVQPT
jgi:UDP-N-acetylglucosamine 3-dehydrogenase